MITATLTFSSRGPWGLLWPQIPKPPGMECLGITYDKAVVDS
jgi:hypothetical protein